MGEVFLRVEGLAKSFDSVTLFRNVSFDLSVGETVAVTGPSGVGKTTLLRAIAGLEAFEGRITVGDSAVDPSGESSNRHCVLVTQAPHLWDHLSCLDNVALVRKVVHGDSVREGRRRALEYLEAFDVAKLASRFPHRLSGGEQQRVALARGFATERQLVLLDEVTSNIDQQRRDLVAGAIRSLAVAGRSVVFVSHDLKTAALVAERVFTLLPSGLAARDSERR